MRLPPELKLGILQYNEKKDLKAVRLTNKDWSVCTLQFLFDRIYWSPQNLDLEVFDSLVNNTELAPHIRELVFDACHFNVNTSKEEYFEQFCYCIILDLLAKDALFCEYVASSLFKRVDSSMRSFLTTMGPIESTGSQQENSAYTHKGTLWDQFRTASFVNEGYETWMTCARNKQNRMNDPTVLGRFSEGLVRLSNLQSVSMTQQWSRELYLRESHVESGSALVARRGSPLTRSWNIFYARPCDLYAIDKEVRLSDGFQGFTFLSTALSNAKKRPVKLLVGSSVRDGLAALFDSSSQSLEMHDIFVNAYHNLNHLTLYLTSTVGVGMPLDLNDCTGLGRLLNSLSGLQYLKLELPVSYGAPRHYYTYNNIFQSTDGCWPRLHTLKLCKFVIGTGDLIRLLSEALPSLRNLEISKIELLDGSWEWIIEYLRNLKLEGFGIDSWTQLLYANGRIYGYPAHVGGRNNAKYRQFIEDVVLYVLSGTRHPSLCDHEEDGASERYSRELKDFLER